MLVADLDGDIAAVSAWEPITAHLGGSFCCLTLGRVQVGKLKPFIVGDEVWAFAGVEIKTGAWCSL
jgi:hypothetical protein